MKILFDKGTPAPLRHSLAGHEISIAFERGWHMLQNGELLHAADADGFAAIVTTDQSLRYLTESRQPLASSTHPAP